MIIAANTEEQAVLIQSTSGLYFERQ